MARLSISGRTPKVVIDFYVIMIPKEKTDVARCVLVPRLLCRSERAGELFEDVDQPGGGVQDRKTPRKFFLAIDVVEKFERTFIARMALRGIAKQMQTRRKFSAAHFQIIVTLAEALPFLPGRLVWDEVGHDASS